MFKLRPVRKVSQHIRRYPAICPPPSRPDSRKRRGGDSNPGAIILKILWRHKQNFRATPRNFCRFDGISPLSLFSHSRMVKIFALRRARHWWCQIWLDLTDPILDLAELPKHRGGSDGRGGGSDEMISPDTCTGNFQITCSSTKK